MAVDASIPLQVKLPQFNTPLEAQAQAASLRDQIAQTQLRQQQVQQGVQTLRDQQELSRAWSDRSNINPETGLLDPTKVQQQFSNPAIYQKVVQMNTDALYNKDKAAREKTLATSETYKAQESAAHDLREEGISAYQNQLDKTPNNRQLAVDAFNKTIREGADKLNATGIMGKGWAPPPDLTPELAIKRSMTYKERLAQQEKEKSSALAERSEKDVERHRRVEEGQAAARERRIAEDGKGGGQPPSGYRKTASGDLEFIPGGPADPKTKEGKLGNREQVYLQRTMTSANEAARDLENVVQLPITASTGYFGGRSQGTSIMAATKEVLANKMTPQEVQSYNVLSSGFQRSLAGIESSGLAPPGSLSHQMDAVIFKEGDTNTTKLQKLAQTRQIVEAGLETTLANPRVPEDQRKHIEGIIESIKKSVPFTQTDIIRMQNEQEKNPKATLQSTMKKMQKETKSTEGLPTATNPQTGEKLVFKDGSWQPIK